mgnify:CR=1 FL=1
MMRFVLSLLAVVLISSPAFATSYDVGMRGEGTQTQVACGSETACKGALPLTGHQPIQFTVESTGGLVVVTFFQAGYHLSVQPTQNRTAKGTFVLDANALKVGQPVTIPLIVSAPDAGNLQPKVNEANPETAPVPVEITINRVTR